MTLDDILQDIYALEEEMRTYERKYGVLSETFYESYVNGEEPPDDAWVQDWDCLGQRLQALAASARAVSGRHSIAASQ